MSAPASINGGDEPLPEPDYDHLDLSFHDLNESGDLSNSSFCKASSKTEATCYSQYILGTLIVRVVAARDLEPVQKGGLGEILFGNSRTSRELRSRNAAGNAGSANPYASVRFCGQSQRTTEVYDTTDPIWPRGETMFFDVGLPVSNMVQEEMREESIERSDAAVAAPQHAENHRAEMQEPPPPPPRPIVTVALFHASEPSSHMQKYPGKSAKTCQGDSDEPFLGMTSVDLTSVLTGKVSSFDEWLPLSGTESTRGKVRIVCEYDATDPPPRPGDKLRFTSYCNPADLYPVPPGRTYVVEEADGDELVLSYTSPEGWLCTFAAHRFMFLCAERHHGAIESYQQELAKIRERLEFSPLVSTLTETIERVPDDGLIVVGVDAVKEGASLLGRWLKGGVGTAVGDIVYATNLDGRFNPETLDSLENREDREENRERASLESGLASVDQTVSDRQDPLPGMPCCPITGEPMRDPVVAADGHTYERRAITRWLQTSHKSPLTGALLLHKDLVPNYMLVSSLQDAATPQVSQEDN